MLRRYTAAPLLDRKIFPNRGPPHSHGFRPGRSAKQAVHDRLLAAVAKRVADKRMLNLIRAFLEAGVMEDGLVSPVDEGRPQGGPLSPLLSNLALDELDRELERRGHRFVRYADDCNWSVRASTASTRPTGVGGVTTFQGVATPRAFGSHRSIRAIPAGRSRSV